jgi:uncharacterized protein (DUF2147 family)
MSMKNCTKWPRALSALLMLSVIPVPLLASTATEHQLTGNWARDDGGTRIKIVPCGANFCATNTWVKDPKGKEHVGDELILTLQPVSDSVLKGQGYDVRRKMKFSMTITLQAASMHTSGCVLLGVLCKNADWSRQNQ